MFIFIFDFDNPNFSGDLFFFYTELMFVNYVSVTAASAGRILSRVGVFFFWKVGYIFYGPGRIRSVYRGENDTTLTPH